MAFASDLALSVQVRGLLRQFLIPVVAFVLVGHWQFGVE
jgi:hypothetical protein